MLFVDEKPNMKRQYEFDFAKAVAIFTMVIVHVYECLSNVVYYEHVSDLYDHVLQFVSGPLAAPVLMIAMGVGIVYSTHRTCAELAKRGLHLFILSYTLNFFRFGLSYTILSHVTGSFDWEIFINKLLCIDILQFAGLSFLLTAILKKLNVSVSMMGVVALLMQIVGHCLSALEIKGTVAKLIFGLFFTTTDMSFFPLLLWYIYPVIGIILAKYLRHVSDTDRFYKSALILALTIFVSLCFALKISGYNIGKFYLLENDIYYQQDFISVLLTICVVLIEVSIFHFVRKLIKSKKLLNAIYFLSSNLNTIYIFQWLIIGNAMAYSTVYDLKLINKSAVLPVGLLVTSASIALTILWSRIKVKYKSNKNLK